MGFTRDPSGMKYINTHGDSSARTLHNILSLTLTHLNNDCDLYTPFARYLAVRRRTRPLWIHIRSGKPRVFVALMIESPRNCLLPPSKHMYHQPFFPSCPSRGIYDDCDRQRNTSRVHYYINRTRLAGRDKRVLCEIHRCYGWDN